MSVAAARQAVCASVCLHVDSFLLSAVPSSSRIPNCEHELFNAGAVACQVLDAIYPGEVPMAKVRWDAKSSHEFIDNYKLVQRVFDKKGVDKHVGEFTHG